MAAAGSGVVCFVEGLLVVRHVTGLFSKLLFSLAAAMVVGGGLMAFLGHKRGPRARRATLTVGGHPLPDGDTGAWSREMRALAEARCAGTIKLTHAEEGFTFPLTTLGCRVDAERLSEDVQAALAFSSELEQIAVGLFGESPRDVPLLATYGREPILATLEPLKKRFDRAPTPAKLDLDHHEIVEEKNGRYLSGEALLVELQGAHDEREKLALPVLDVAPRISGESLRALDIRNVVGTFHTTFGRGGIQSNRARNIEVAAARINGVVLSPGEMVSFNRIVGERSVANGFRHAPEIFKGEMVDGIGGGTCQVASTLHAASFFGGLDILERLPHSRPSAYVNLGLDATVVYPAVDLKIKNPFAFPVAVHAFVAGNTVHVELLGKEKPVEVSYGQNVLGTFAFTRKIVEDASVDKPIVKQKGIRGIQIRRHRVMRFAGGEERQETSVDMYPPTQEIVRVPPGYNPDELPPVGGDPIQS